MEASYGGSEFGGLPGLTSHAFPKAACRTDHNAVSSERRPLISQDAPRRTWNCPLLGRTRSIMLCLQLNDWCYCVECIGLDNTAWQLRAGGQKVSLSSGYRARLVKSARRG